MPFLSDHSSILKVVTWSAEVRVTFSRLITCLYMPIGPTGRISASCCPFLRVCSICCAMASPIFLSIAATSLTTTGLNSLCQCLPGLVSFFKPIAQHRSIFLRFQPRG